MKYVYNFLKMIYQLLCWHHTITPYRKKDGTFSFDCDNCGKRNVKR